MERMRAWRDAAPWQALPFLLLLLVGACAGLSVKPERMAGIRTIGIISALPEVFQVKEIGLTVFGNDVQGIPIGSWGIDDLVIGKVRGLLSKRFDQRPVTYQRSIIALANPGWDGLGEKIRPYISTQGLDAYVVLKGGSSQYINTNQILYGFGMVEHLTLNYFLYALYGVILIDGHDFSQIGATAAYLPEMAPPLSGPIRGPHLKIDKSWWPTSLDPAANPQLKAGVIDLIDKSLAYTLQRIQLAD